MASFISETGMSRSPSDTAAPSMRSGGTRSRTQSISSDRPSTITHSLMSPPIAVSPEAAFIAASAASQIVTNDHDSHADTWYDQNGFDPSGETAIVSPSALRLVNQFLDQLLFNFILVSGSTSLSSLRPAVTEVLKPKLAKDVINNAEEELREYLGGDDDEEILQDQSAPSPRDWDVELVWKRTRLRCMVYSSLGDMEEEDEDRHMEEGCLGDADETLGGFVSPAVAIFLTSILEYLGEQALVMAGQAAWNRLRVRYEREIKDGHKSRADAVDRIVVEEIDMERVALDRTLGRLWRAWKKRIRSPVPGGMDIGQRPASRNSKGNHPRQGSHSNETAVPLPVQKRDNEPDASTPGSQLDGESSRVPDSLELPEDERAAAIPLPMSDRDVDEIEVPGLVQYSDDEEDEVEESDDEVTRAPRPKSLMILPCSSKGDLPTPTMSQPHTPVFEPRKRSNSLPTPDTSPYAPPRRHAKAQAAAAEASETAQPQDEAMPKEEAADRVEDVVQPANGDRELSEPKTSPTSTTTSMDSSSEPERSPMPDAMIKRDSKSESVGTVSKYKASVVGGSAASVEPSAAMKRKEAPAEAEDSDYEEIEEAQIMTSSRISIGGSVSGRSNSPANSDRGGKPPLSIQTLPVRSGSLRLVDVSSPRTPSTRSRGSSVQEADHIAHPRSADASRTSSIQSQPIAEGRLAEDTRHLRGSGTSSLAKSRTSVSHSISEAEENAKPVTRKPVPTSKEEPRSPHVSVVRDYAFNQNGVEIIVPHIRDTQAIFGSVRQQSRISPQRSPVQQQRHSPEPSQTKVTTALGVPSQHQGTFFEDDSTMVPKRSAKQARSRPSPPHTSPVLPDVPENNVSRRPHTQSQGAVSQPATIGIVSVDRGGGAYRDVPEPSGPSQDQSTIRQLHTSGSSTTSSSVKVRGPRGSQDSTGTRPEDVARNFEELIHSGETLQYTLTPESMRDMEPSRPGMNTGSPLVPTKSRKSEDIRQVNRDRSASLAAKVVEAKRSASITRSTGLHSHPVDVASPVDKVGGVVPKAPPVSMQNRARGAAPQARDPRVPRESLVEFAEFIRATGPSGADAGPTPLKRNASLVRNHNGQITVSRPTNSVDWARHGQTGSVARARLQARDATVDNRDNNSDLIDFIRRGPPTTGNGNHRIPRNVAPFRTTMDSDQLAGAVGGKAVDATLPELHDTRYSQASTNVTDVSAPSVQSSINSQSALLGRSKHHVSPSAGQFDEQDMMPVRKQHRVRDPYAIDLSDGEEEDDDLELQPRRRQQPKEESLMDFLKNAPPPPQQAPMPFNIQTRPPLPQKPAQAPKKKASAPSLMSRFRGNNSISGNAIKNPRSPSAQETWDSRSLSSRAGGAHHAASSSTATKGYIPIQVNIPTGGDLYSSFATSTTPSPPVPPLPSNVTGGNKVPMKRYEPRDAVSVPSRGTSDLADFLRSSEPPAPVGGPSAYDSEQPDLNGGSRMFGRRKKSTFG